MSGELLLGQLGLLALAVLTLIAAVVCALVYPRVRPRIARLEPARRAQVLLLLSGIPAITGLALTAVCFLPSLASGLWESADHCPHHAAGHAHLCLTHLPASGHGVIASLLAGGVVVVLVLLLARRMVETLRSRRLLGKLVESSRRDETRGVWVAETRAPIALTAGLLRSRIVVSSGLLERLPPESVDALLAHERAHVRRRDPLRKLVARVVSAVHLPGTRRQILDDLALATEQTCDEEAGAFTGDRLQVAQAMLAVERLLESASRGVEAGLAAEYFGGVSVAPRVEALLADRRPSSPSWRVWATIAAAIALAVLVASPIHHATETLLGLIAQ